MIPIDTQTVVSSGPNAKKKQKGRCGRKPQQPFPGYITLSGHWDLNPGPLAPHASALAGLRHAPDNVHLLYTGFPIPQRNPPSSFRRCAESGIEAMIRNPQMLV